MIVTKNVPSSTAIESGTTVKVLQDDCITISREEYSLFVANGIKLDMIANAIQMLRYDSDRLDTIRMILDLPKEDGA